MFFYQIVDDLPIPLVNSAYVEQDRADRTGVMMLYWSKIIIPSCFLFGQEKREK